MSSEDTVRVALDYGGDYMPNTRVQSDGFKALDELVAERDRLAARVDELIAGHDRDEWQRLAGRYKQALEQAQAMQPARLAYFRETGIVFDRAPTGDPHDWQQIAFDVYTDLCEIESISRAALDGEEQ